MIHNYLVLLTLILDTVECALLVCKPVDTHALLVNQLPCGVKLNNCRAVFLVIKRDAVDEYV